MGLGFRDLGEGIGFRVKGLADCLFLSFENKFIRIL